MSQTTLNCQTMLEGGKNREQPGTLRVHPQIHRSNWAVESDSYPPIRAMQARCLGLNDAAAYLGVSKDTVRGLEWSGVLPRVRLSNGNGGEIRKLLFDVRDLDALIDRSKG